MGIVLLGHAVRPLTDVNPTDPSYLERLSESLTLGDLVAPFLAHALGTLVGAYVCARLARTHKRGLALGIGALFLLGGIMVAIQLPAPLWFEIVDILFAYLPMALLGVYLAKATSAETT